MIFEVKNGCFGYTENQRILHEISIRLSEGRIMAVLGPNGVGKTTLLKCMMGLLHWDRGESILDGRNIRSLPQRTIWQKMAYVPQAKGRPMPYTAEEMVVLGRSAHLGVLAQPRKEDYAKAHRAMADVNIMHLCKKPCTQMSGGEFQMVLIARALTADPSMLVLDEPESNLDFKNQLIILNTMRRLADEKNISCVFNTHYPDHALKIADDALLLDKNGRSLFGCSSDIINRDNLRRAFEVEVHIQQLQFNEHKISSVIPLSIV